MTNILIFAEHSETALEPATLCAITAAQKIGGEIDLLVCGAVAEAASQDALKASGVRSVLYADGAEYDNALAEPLAWMIQSLADNYDVVIAAATTLGKDVLPRAAALCDVQQVSDIIEVIDATTYRRPIYAGNAIETIKDTQSKHFITIRPTAFDKAEHGSGNAELKKVENKGTYEAARFIELQETISERPELTAADIVVSGGRGTGSGENFANIIEPLADKLGAAIGASRAAVDAGYVPNDYQVGQTGKVVAPNLYIAVGISGAIQHIAGMKESKVIVAINKDENAPIFDVADYGLVADLFEAVPEMVGKL